MRIYQSTFLNPNSPKYIIGVGELIDEKKAAELHKEHMKKRGRQKESFNLVETIADVIIYCEVKSRYKDISANRIKELIGMPIKTLTQRKSDINKVFTLADNGPE